jgi:hypothetical protein
MLIDVKVGMDMVQNNIDQSKTFHCHFAQHSGVKYLNPTKPFRFSIVYMNTPSTRKHHPCYAPPQYRE